MSNQKVKYSLFTHTIPQGHAQLASYIPGLSLTYGTLQKKEKLSQGIGFWKLFDKEKKTALIIHSILNPH